MILMAMDRATVRRVDAQGFLHVETSPISKANICPYYGREIPNWQHLGLDGDRVYRLYRDPEELAKAASTFNNLPLLSEHVPVDADTIPDHLIVGSTGSHCAFDGKYLNNSLSVWKRKAIDGINSRRKKELSSAYRYRADMTPGEHGGLPYDGRLCDIVGNHVALVFEGRAGPDVVVGDKAMKITSRTALMAHGALAALVVPLLAKDAQIDITDALDGVTGETMLGMDAAIADKVIELVTPHLAADQTLDADTVKATIALVPVMAQDDNIAEIVLPKADPKAKPAANITNIVGMDEAAVNAKVAEASAASYARAMAEGTAIRTAEKAVAPFVGELPAMDSAAAYYKVGLGHFKVDTASLPEESYAATFNAVAAVAASAKTARIAQDSARNGVSVLAGIVPDLQPMKVL